MEINVQEVQGITVLELSGELTGQVGTRRPGLHPRAGTAGRR